MINFFEVAPTDDDDFLRRWRESRDFFAAQPGFSAATLHEAVTTGARFRFVNVAQWESPAAFQVAAAQPQFALVQFPFRFHAAMYRVAVAESVARSEDGDLVVINPFDVSSSVEPFLSRWRAAADAMKTQAGYVSALLHRSVRAEARFGFVNVARWRTVSDFHSAIAGEAFQSLPPMPFPNYPALYRPMTGLSHRSPASTVDAGVIR